jgi:hypothetical protein
MIAEPPPQGLSNVNAVPADAYVGRTEGSSVQITGVQLALHLTLASAAMLLGAWALVRRTIETCGRSQVRALIEPSRAESWVMLPSTPELISIELRRPAANRAPPGSSDLPRQSAGEASR